MTQYTRPISSILTWLPYHRFIFQFTSPSFQINNLLQAHNELFKLISNPDYNRFDDKHLGYLSDYNFDSSPVKAKDNFTFFIVVWDIDENDFWDMDSILQFAAFLKAKGLKIVFVPAFNFAKQSTKRLLQELNIECIELLVHISQINASMMNKEKNFFIITISGNAEGFGSQNEIVISFAEDCKTAINVSNNKIEVCKQDFLCHKTLEIIFTKIKRSQMGFNTNQPYRVT